MIFESVLHFMMVAVTPETMSFKAFRPADRGDAFEVFDAFEIPKECGWPVREKAASAGGVDARRPGGAYSFPTHATASTSTRPPAGRFASTVVRAGNGSRKNDLYASLNSPNFERSAT